MAIQLFAHALLTVSPAPVANASRRVHADRSRSCLTLVLAALCLLCFAPREATGQQRQVAGGDRHTLWVKADGTLWAWGDNAYGQLGNGGTAQSLVPVQIGAENGWVAVAGGVSHSLALKADGTLWAWGHNDHGQLGTGGTADSLIPVRIGSQNKWAAISAGASHSLGLEADGTLWAWGADNSGQLGTGGTADALAPVQIGSDTWVTVAAGASHSLGVKSDGTLWAWGANNYGQLGSGSTADSLVPVQVGSENTWVAVSAGASHSVGLKADGTLWTWGRNDSGQLGTGATADSFVPVQVGSENNWVAASAGLSFTLGLKSDGTLWAWGLNNSGQLGDGTTANRTSPVQSGSNNTWYAIAAGSSHGLGLRSAGALWAWGSNAYGQLGNGATTNTLSAVTIASNDGWKVASGGNYYSLGLRADGSLWGWGDNSFGQLGTGGTSGGSLPLRIGSENNWAFITAGYIHTLGIKADGTLWGWGSNGYGQAAGNGTHGGLGITSPIQVGIDTHWTYASGGYYYSVALKSDGTLWAWGDNTYGQLGLGDNTARYTPVQVPGIWKAVSAGAFHTMAIKSDGTLWTWGRNNAGTNQGMLGDGTNVGHNTPEQIDAGTTWNSVSGGFSISAAIKTDGTLWTWGGSHYGEQCHGDIANHFTPTQVGNDTNWVSVTAKNDTTHTIKSDGTLWGCGANTYGQLGTGTNTDKLILVQIGSENKWVSLGRTFYHALAVKADGSMWAWGRNQNGQLGDGTTVDKNAPVEVGLPDPEASLGVAPSDGLASSGSQGGPFSPLIKTYTLTNRGGNSMTWAASNSQTWVSLSSLGGILGVGESVTVTVSINNAANSLALGSYSDTVSFTNVTNGHGNTARPVNLSVLGLQPDLTVLNFTGPAEAVVPGETIVISDTTANAGPGAAATSVTKFIWSTNTAYDTQDTVLGTRTVPALDAGASSGPISTSVTVPAGVASGTYYIIAVADATGVVAEISETNNTNYAAVIVTLGVSSLSLSPSAVVGGVSTTSYNRVILAGPAPAGGATVSLTSSNPVVAAVPASVIVPAGTTQSAAFTITTAAVDVTTPVTISAAYLGVTTTATLTVNPPALSALNLFIRTVVGGGSTSGNKVTLTGPAPASGVTVALSSSDPTMATVPASIVVPAGATQSAGFTITIAAVDATTTVTLSANYAGVTKTATLTVNPPALSSLTLSPSTVLGGGSTTSNRVNLNGPAGPAGVAVTLSSSNPTTATPPATVTVAAGQKTSPPFTITTASLAASTAVTITASYSGVAKTANLTVNPLALSSLRLSPSTVPGGTSTTSSTVTLAGPAPVGGAMVVLASSNPTLAAVPASVVVPEGATQSPAFSITTSLVDTITQVTVSASYGGVTKTATLTVTPPALSSLILSPSTVVGGGSTTSNRVSLNAPAGPAGVVVTLSSSNPAAAAAPATVTVPPGQTSSAMFTITTATVAATTTVQVTASYSGVTKSSNLTVSPLTLSSLALSPSSVVGGASATGNKITLSGPAPEGGVTVALSSSNPSVAAVPASVVVPAGTSQSPVFTITTIPLDITTQVTISASYAGAVKTATFTVKQPSLSSLALSPSTVVGGVSTTSNKVTLNGPAGPAGVIVNLTSSNPSVASTPAAVAISAGQISSPLFTITTTNVLATTIVPISASYLGVSQSLSLTVNPPQLASVYLQMRTLVGGPTTSGNKVTLTGPAPPEGATVTVTSSNPTVAAVPASVVVPSGATQSSLFTIATRGVDAATAVTISATYAGLTKIATLTVNPPSLSVLALSPSTVVGGGSTASSYVKLNGVAGPSGVVVTLSSANPAVAAAPSTVTVLPGQISSPVFTITTAKVSASTVVPITASYSGVAKTSNLTVNP